MFFIVNKTKGVVTLGDIGVTLGPRQAVDLDKIMKRDKSEGSRSLMDAKRKGALEVRVKDAPQKRAVPNTEPKPQLQSNDLGDMKKEIIGEMKALLQNQVGGVSKADLQELIAAMPKSTETVIYRQEGEKIREDEEVEMDEDTLATINARTVDNIVKDTKVESVHYKEKQTENTILDNVDELMDLL